METLTLACLIIVAGVAGYLAAVLQRSAQHLASMLDKQDSIILLLQGVQSILAENNKLLHEVPTAPSAVPMPDGFYAPLPDEKNAGLMHMRRVDEKFQVGIPGRT